MSYHGNLLKQYLVCQHYSFPDLGSSDLKGYVKAVCETLSISTIRFNVLAVVPINILIEGKPTVNWNFSREFLRNFADDKPTTFCNFGNFARVLFS